MDFLCSELTERLNGVLIGPDRRVVGATIDSRTVEPDQLFVAIVSERDGHEFAAGAVAAGAAATLSSRRTLDLGGCAEPTVIVVPDTEIALTELGRVARQRLTGPVIGITGSVGKTSLKDLTLAACSGSASSGGLAWASAQSFNNELGVPLTLANAPGDTAIAIIEMGSRGIGHIAQLCDVAKPTVGVVTSVALVHSELFGSIEAVAKGKGELVESLPVDGTAVLNADDPLVMAMASRSEASVITFGSAEGTMADVAATEIAVDDLLRPRFIVRSPWGTADLELSVRGVHMAHNAVGALAAAVTAGVDFDDALAGLAAAELSRWRMDVQRTTSGAVVVNDAYNANPTSMRAALAALVGLASDRRVAVVGVMAELGPEGPAEHRAIAEEAARTDIEIIAVDAPDYGPLATHVSGIDGARAVLGVPQADTAVLVKGSRVAGLERLAERLLADEGAQR